MANWQGHETHPTGYSTSEVDWVGHDPNNMNESLLSEADWGAHDTSVFPYLDNMDCDARSKEFFIQELWGELQHRTPSIPLIGLQTDSLATEQTGDDIFNSTLINPYLDDPEQLTGKSVQSYHTLVGQLQWLVTLGRLATHAQAPTSSKLKLTQKKLQRAYGYVLQITENNWTQSKYCLHETLIKHWDPFKSLKMATKLLMTYGGIILISRPTFMNIHKSSK